MPKVFKSIAGACFEINQSGKTVTVEGVEFVYVAGADRDAYAANAVGTYIDKNLEHLSTEPLRLVWVQTSKATEITSTSEVTK